MAGRPKDLDLGIPEIDVEHALQLQLVQAVRAALESGDLATAHAALGRLDDVTNAHFLAEQLLMRLHAYPGYAAHVQEHDRLIEELRSLWRQPVGTGDAEGIAQRLELWLRVHIATADEAFASYLAEVRARAAAPAEH
jgi:hemerythrin-like metal-binding protein